MTEPQPITEAEHVHDAWYEVKPQTPKELAEFARHLHEDYVHDYGTACHATAALTLAGGNLMAHLQGITGFQASAAAWEYLTRWWPLHGPARLVDFENLLYPQYAEKFEKTITSSTWEWAQDRARELLAEHEDKSPDFVNTSVRDHWRSIADGHVPFGLRVTDEAA